MLAFGAAIVWGLAGKAIPALFEDGGRAARLRDPIGYWNALALAGDALLVLCLWLATSRWRRAVRLGAAVLGYAAVVAVLLAVSRAGLLAAVAGVALWLALVDRRLERGLVALAVIVPAFLVAAWAFTRDGARRRRHRPTPTGSPTVAGSRSLSCSAPGAVVLAVRALERYRPREATRQRLGRCSSQRFSSRSSCGVGAVAAAGDPLESSDAVGQNPSRLGDVGLNKRGELWREAWRTFEAEPLAGSGAGTFEVARKRHRDDALDAAEPHNLPLQFLATTGSSGSCSSRCGRGGRGGRRRCAAAPRRAGACAAAALAVVPAVYLLHALVDYDWDFPAVTAPTLFAVGALAACRPGAGKRSRRPLAAAAAVAFVAAALVSLATPWLAERSCAR